MLTLGLTGGIGSGKSTVGRLLSLRASCRLIDADALAHRLTAPGGAAIVDIEGVFGRGALSADGGMDRAWMRNRIFSDPVARATLEGIVHPLIREALIAEIDAARSIDGLKCVVAEVPLLAESSIWSQYFDRVIVVDCEQQTQIKRVMVRSGLDRPTVEKIIQSQLGRARRRQFADVVIVNDQDHESALHSTLAELAEFLRL